MTKKLLSLVIVFLLVVSVFVPVLSVEAIALTSWEWNTTSNNEGWTKNEYISDECVANGYYTLNITGGDAYITSPLLSIDTTRFSEIELTYRNATECSNADFFWTCSDGGWSGQRGLKFATIPDGEWHTTTINLSENSYYTGTLTQLRLDPVQDASGIFEIDKLRFVPNSENAAYWNFSVAGNFEGWSCNNQMDSCNVSDSSLNMTFSGQTDPILTKTDESVDTAIYQKLVLTYRNSTDCTQAEFYWNGLGESWSPDRLKTIETVNDGDWHNLVVDLSTEENWVGTVKNIRFDPVSNATGTFELDRIVLASQNAIIDSQSVNIASQISWDFAHNHDGIGWTQCNNVATTGVIDGAIFFNISNASDPYVLSPELTLDSTVYNKFYIRYRSTINTNLAQLYWKNENTGFSEAASTSFELDNSGNWNTAVVDLSANSNWTDIITQLRFDFAQSGTGFIEIDKITLISETVVDEPTSTTKGGNTTVWNFVTDDDYMGWTLNSDIANWDVAHGNMVALIQGGADPNFTSPAISMDSKKYKIVEIKYKNEIPNESGRIYWETDNGGINQTNSCAYTSVSDGVWHTVRLDMSDNPNWTGNITRLRIDPVTGGYGHYYIDRVALMDLPSRYTLSNGYIYLSGVNGSIDIMRFDPDGNSNYSENMLMGELYMGVKYNDTAYSSSCSDVNWTIKNNTLTINNIFLGGSNLTGKWTITLNDNKLDNSFVVNSKLSTDTTLYDFGYCYDMVWDNDGFDVEKTPVGSLRVPFKKIISSDDRYHSAYAYKRMPSVEDESTIGFTGGYIDIEGANGYDFNLRMSCDTARISPICFVDHVKFQFRNQNSSVQIQPGEYMVRTLGIEVSQNADIIPDHFVSFDGADPEVTAALNEMLYEFGNSREPHCTNPDWAEWISTIRAWQDDSYIEKEKGLISNYIQQDDGYVYTWGSNPGWPFPAGYDTNHYITTSANLINATYNYYVYDGDEQFLQNNLSRIRLAMDFLLKQYDTNYNLFRIDHEHHNGASRGVGSNYWDIVPYGNLSAYDNIYGYLALTRMAQIEKHLNNDDRANELQKYADDLKVAYNELFWAGDHYIQVIDANNQTHDYGCVYLNLEAITYGLADDARAKTILDFMTNTVTSSGEADVFSEFVFAPRATMFHNPSLDEGGWYCCVWPGGDDFGSSQIQNGGTIFYIAYYELMSRIKAYGADNSYERLKEIIERYNIEHLQGGTFKTGELNQHFTSGLVGCWGEFPENGLVPIAAKNGYMGISVDIEGLDVSPQMPQGLSDLTVNRMNFRDMHLDITTTDTSVRIKATKNDSEYDDWFINGQKVDGLFDVTINIENGQTVSLYRATEKYDIGDVDLNTEIEVDDVTQIQRALVRLEEFSQEQVALADTNNDGFINIADATCIQLYIAQLIDSLPI